MARVPSRAVVAVALLVALAGCSLLPGGGGGGLPGTTLSASTTTESLGTLPPGLTGEGVADPFALAAAHGDALRGSYTVDERVEIRFANGTPYRVERSTAEVAVPDSRYRYTVSANGTGPNFLGGGNGTLSVYADGSVAARRLVAAGNTSTQVYTDAAGDPVDPAVVFHGTPRNDERLATLLSYVVNETVERRTPSAYRLRATRFSTDTLSVRGTTVRNLSVASFTATVTEDGRVTGYDLRLAGTVDGRRVTVRETVRYSAVGTTTVEPPAWFEDAVPGTAER